MGSIFVSKTSKGASTLNMTSRAIENSFSWFRLKQAIPERECPLSLPVNLRLDVLKIIMRGLCSRSLKSNLLNHSITIYSLN